MSLNYQFTKNFEDIKDEPAINDALIWATMSVGIREITEANYKEFYERLHLAELVRGTHLMKAGSARFITEDEVRKRIGLTTNVSTFGRAEFHKRLFKGYYTK